MNNMTIWERAAEAAAALGGLIVGLYGGWSASLSVLVVFMCADYILGVACALARKSQKTEGGGFLSKVAFIGLLKKAVIMLVVMLAVQLDQLVGQSATFETGAVFFYIANEGLSIVENAALLGVPVPKPLRDSLEVLRNKHSQGDHQDEHPDDQSSEQ